MPNQPVFNQAYSLDDLGILVLDMRSERQPHTPKEAPTNQYTPDQVMSEVSWNAVYKWLDKTQPQHEFKHLLVM